MAVNLRSLKLRDMIARSSATHMDRRHFNAPEATRGETDNDSINSYRPKADKSRRDRSQYFRIPVLIYTV